MPTTNYHPLLILGMHRSGTSCLTGCLEDAGLHLGTVNEKAGFNLKGNRENRTVMDLHDRILTRNGAAWNNPPSTPLGFTSADQKDLHDLLETYPAQTPIGFKDPRSLFCLSLWKTVTRPRFIGTFRHPLEVAGSLMRRAKVWKQPMPLSTALDLWAAYNRQLLREYAAAPFPLIRYDIPAALYEQKLRAILPELGLPDNASFEFREDNLKTQSLSDPIPPALDLIWDTLNRLAI